MCGIAGHASFTAPASPEQVMALTRGIGHRGPDDKGSWVSPGGRCAFGHARLSIIDLSPLGHQPMLDPLTGNCICYNGEIYNFQALRRECEALGDVFRSQSDTEVVLALYRRHGIACLSKLRGMFALALWDERRQCLFLARDRMGKKPLNYARTDGGLYFCSELAPLSRAAGVSRAPDAQARELYLQLGYIPAPWTIYGGIRKLPPAHYACLDRDGLRIERYWELDYTRKIAISEDDALDGLEEKLTEAVRLRMIADVPLGALLSGGVDSSVVVALMAKLADRPVRTYSVGFGEESHNELPYAETAARICGTEHHPEIVEGDVAGLLPVLAAHYGEPYADSSAVPSFFVCRSAREHVTVAMNGDGGDELLGGYPRYGLSQAQIRIAAALGGLASPSRQAALAARLSEVTSFPKRVARKLTVDYVAPELRSVVLHADFWNDTDRARLLGRAGTSDIVHYWRSTWLEGARRHAGNAIDLMLWYDNNTYLPGDLLPKMDIASMHVGLETRSPLLDHEVIEYCAALPPQLKVSNGVGKSLLKKLACRYFSRDFVYRPKMGFGIPLAGWLRGPLRQVLADTLRSPGLMEPFDGAMIETTLSDFHDRGIDRSSRLWSLLMYGQWRQQAAP